MTQVTQLPSIFQTPGFANFSKEYQRSFPYTVGDDGSEKESPYTIGEILANDPVRLESLIQSEYLIQQAEQGNEEALSLRDNLDIDTANALQEYLGRYVYDIQEITPMEPLKTQPTPRLNPFMGRSVPTATDKETKKPTPLIPVVSDETDYSGITESLMSEEDRKELANFGLNPNRIFDKDNEDKWSRYILSIPEIPEMNFSTERIERGETVSVPDALLPNKDDPWRAKAAFFPIEMTPFEAEKLLENEFPNIKARYINPHDPGMGIAVSIPKEGATATVGPDGRVVPAEEEWVALRPQFGYEMLSEEVITAIAQEMTGIMMEGGIYKGLQKIFKRGLRESGEYLARQGSIPGKLGRGMLSAGAIGISAGMGRFLQLAYGKGAGINNIDAKRAFEDAGLATALAGSSAAVIGSTMGLLSSGWGALTGSNIPKELLAEIQSTIGRVKTAKKQPEFSNEELIKRTQQAAQVVGEGLSDFDRVTPQTSLQYEPTLGEETQSDFLKALEIELFAAVYPTDKGRQLYNAIYENNAEVTELFWKELQKDADLIPEGITFADFQDFFKAQREEYVSRARKAAELRKIEIERGAQLSHLLTDEDPLEMLTVDELGSTFRRGVEGGGIVYKRTSPEFLKVYDDQYIAARDEVGRQVDKLANIKYDEAGQSSELIQPTFQSIFGVGDASDQIIRDLGDVEASAEIKKLMPMRDGISAVRQLIGSLKDKEGNEIPLTDYNYGQLTGMYNSLNTLFISNPNRAVRTAVDKLRTAVETQMDDLLTVEARRRLQAKDIFSPTPEQLQKELTTLVGPLREAQQKLMAFSEGIERKWLKEFVAKDPIEMANTILSSSPKQVSDLLAQIYKSPDSIVRLGNLRQMVIENIRATMGDKPLKEQNIAWKEFLEEKEGQLKALFPESDFLKLTDFSKVQDEALQEINRITESMKELQEELGQSPVNFIKDFLLAGKSGRATGEVDMKLNDLREFIDQNPEVQPYVNALVKNFMRDNFEMMRLEEGNIFETGAFKQNEFISFIDEQMKPGAEGTQKLGLLFGKLMGKEEGMQYAKDLRMLGKILDRGVNRSPRGRLAQGLVGKQSIEDYLEESTYAIKFFIPPLTQTGRRITAFMLGFRQKARSDILEILADPSKIKPLMDNLDKQISRREFFKIIGALAAGRQVNIGSETEEDKYDRAIKSVRGEAKGILDVLERAFSQPVDVTL